MLWVRVDLGLVFGGGNDRCCELLLLSLGGELEVRFDRIKGAADVPSICSMECVMVCELVGDAYG